MRVSDQTARRVSITSLVLILILLSFGSVRRAELFAQANPSEDVRYHLSQAQIAYKEKNYSACVSHLRSALNLRPNNPTVMYNLAGAYALVGDREKSIALLQRVADMGLIYPADKDADFAGVKETTEFQRVLDRFKQNRAHKGESLTALTLHEKGLVPESVAYDPVQRTFYIGSVYRRKILSVDAKGAVKEFATQRDGLWSPFGMKVDARRRFLWVCTAAHSQMMGADEKENGSSGILKFDLSSGRLLKKYLLPVDSAKHWLGDLAINAQGDVFATDSLKAAVYRIDHRNDQLEVFIAGDPFISPQGLDFTPDQRNLFVADYVKGLFVVDLMTKAVSPISPAADTALIGIDGLYFYKQSLVAIQNGTNPHRVIRLFLDPKQREIVKSEILEANNPLFDEPTLGVLVKNELYYVANSQWETINKKGELAPDDKLREPVILKLRL